MPTLRAGERRRARRAATGSARREGGFTYLVVLFLVLFLGIGAMVTGDVWHTTVAREKETQLLFIGNQYRRAIELYYLNGPNQYPRALQDLLKDPRKPGTERYLRKLYPDPLTGTDDWGLVKGPDGGIVGVYSRSTAKPFKTAGFSLQDQAFEKAGAYAEWKFVPPVAAVQSAAPQAGQQARQAGQAAGQQAGQPAAEPVIGPDSPVFRN